MAQYLHQVDHGSHDATDSVRPVTLRGAASADLAFLSAPLSVALGAEVRFEKYKMWAGEAASFANGGAQVFPGYTPDNAIDAGRHFDRRVRRSGNQPVTHRADSRHRG